MLERSGDLFDFVTLDDVARLHVAVALEHDAALHPVLDVADVVFEAAQPANFSIQDLDRVAHESNAPRALDRSLGYHAARHRSRLAGLERLANLGLAERLLDERRREKTRHG